MDFNKMTDDDLYNVYKSIVSIEKIKNELLYNELNNININKINDYDECKLFMENTFLRYQPTIINAQLEDDEWIVHDNTSKRYPLKDGEIIYENTIKFVHKYDVNTINYLTKLHTYFNNNIDKDKLKIKLKIIDWTDKMCWVIYLLNKN